MNIYDKKYFFITNIYIRNENIFIVKKITSFSFKNYLHPKIYHKKKLISIANNLVFKILYFFNFLIISDEIFYHKCSIFFDENFIFYCKYFLSTMLYFHRN